MSIYSEPVVGNNFFAREDILNTLLKSAGDISDGYRHNIALIGKGLVGKSSLLLHFLGIVKNYEGLIPAYISLKDTSFTEFSSNYITMLLYHSLKNKKKLKRDNNLDYLISCAQKFFPKSCDLIKRIKSLIAENNHDEAFSSMLDLNVVLSSESGYSLVVVMDEFNLLSTFPIKKPFQILGQKIMVQSKTLFIVSSSTTVSARKILSEKLSLLFGGFQVIDIGSFTPQQTRDFIDKHCKADISDELKDFLLVFTGGHPFYLSSIIQKLNLAREYGRDKISPRDLSQIIAELLFYPAGQINQFFNELLDKIRYAIPDKGTFYILKAILATGRSCDITSRSAVPAAYLHNLLSSLLELGLISKNGSMYAITDGVFRMWVEIKSKPRNLCFDFIPQPDELDYTKEIENRILYFKFERKRGLNEKIIELITSFNNDQFFIDERMRILPSLNYVRQRSLGPDNLLIVAKGKKRWLFVLSNKRLAEEDIDDILKRIKSLNYDNAKVILIAVSDIDNGAKLLAKQKHLWIWNRENISKLFEFYKGYDAIIA